MTVSCYQWCTGGRRGTSIWWTQLLLAATTFVLLNTDMVHGATEPSDSSSQQCEANKFISAERKLTHCLLDSYDPAVRPVSKPSDVVKITVNLVLIKIVELHESEHVLETSVWIHKTWKDEVLKWDPSKYDNVKTLRLPVDRIWKPDLVLYNNANYYDPYIEDKLAVVTNQGQVVWVPHGHFKSYCNLKLKTFPYDTQECIMSFGSWTHDKTKVDIVLPEKHSPKHIYDGKEWEVVHVKVNRQVISYSMNESYPVITWTVTMKRSGAFFTCMLVAPSVILSILIVFVFLVPPASRERLSFAVGILLCQILMFLMLEKYIPQEIADFPTIGVHLLLQIVMVVIAMVISMWVLNCYHRGSRKNKVPNWLRKLCLGRLSRIFCLRPDMYTSIPSDLSTLDNGASELRTADELGLDSSGRRTNAMEATLEDIRKYLKICASKTTEVQPTPGFSSHRELVINEWHEVAMVIDRFMCLLYVMVTVLMIIFVFSHS